MMQKIGAAIVVGCVWVSSGICLGQYYNNNPLPGRTQDDLRWRSAGGETTPDPRTNQSLTDPNNYGGRRTASNQPLNEPQNNGRRTAIPATSTSNRPGIPEPIEPLRPLNEDPRPRVARVTGGNGVLPNSAGQVWREYDITPYTRRVTSTKRPETAIIDWILRETGFEVWHGEHVTVLSADKNTLKVYHTPDMQKIVGELVDRFVDSQAESYAFSLRVVSVESPTWRSRAQSMLRSVPVESQGVEAWLLQKEDAARLLAELQRRSDFREHSSPQLLVNNGQTVPVIATRPRSYVQSIQWRPEAWPGFENQMGQFDEGFSLELSPLLSFDGRSIDAVLKCQINQMEKLHPVLVDTASQVAPRQRTRIDVPQVSQSRLQERFRWPADQVLLVGLGMVPTPSAADTTALIPGLTNTPGRADMMIFLENRGPVGSSNTATGTEPRNYHGRY